MSKQAETHLYKSRVLLVLLLVLSATAWCRSQPPVHAHANRKLATAVDRIFKQGVHASLPPHISTLLGIAQEQECAVVQDVVRAESQVRAFNVSLTDKHNIVIFTVDEHTRDQIFYLTSQDGVLRKIVAVQGGVGRVVRMDPARRQSFQKEVEFWVNRLSMPETTR